MAEINKKVEYNDRGQLVTITIQTDYDSKEVFKLPESCTKCPVGFSCSGDCGRNVPFTNEDSYKRPDTCKLIQSDLIDTLFHESFQRVKYLPITSNSQLKSGQEVVLLNMDGTIRQNRRKELEIGVIEAILPPYTPNCIRARYQTLTVWNKCILNNFYDKFGQDYCIVFRRNGAKLNACRHLFVKKEDWDKISEDNPFNLMGLLDNKEEYHE